MTGKCLHLHQIGDNYGVTCVNCGEALEGFGYWGTGGKKCIKHLWLDNGDFFVCLYCEETKPNDENETGENSHG